MPPFGGSVALFWIPLASAGGIVDDMAASVQPTALLQLWGTAYDMDVDPQADATGYGDPEDDMGFKVKRLRLGLRAGTGGLDVKLTGGVSAAFDAWDDDQGEFALYDASVGYRGGAFGVVGGVQSVPFSRDNLMPSGELTFQERGIGSEHLTDDRGVGVVGSVHAAGFTGRVGVLNSGYTPFGDDNLGKTVVARAEYDVGQRDTYALWGPGDGFALGVGAGGLATFDLGTTTMAAGADVLMRAGPLSVLVDGAWAQVSPANTEVVAPGTWEASTRLSLTGEVGVSIGPVQPAIRVSHYQEGGVGTWTSLFGGVVFHTGIEGNKDLVRLGAGYQMRLEAENLPNDTARLWAQFWLRRPNEGRTQAPAAPTNQ